MWRFTTCTKCEKVNNLFGDNNVNLILERLHYYNKENEPIRRAELFRGKKHTKYDPISYYLDTCQCVKITNNIIDVCPEYPEKSTVVNMMCSYIFKIPLNTENKYYETLKPSDKEYIEFLYYLQYHIHHTMRFTLYLLNKYNMEVQILAAFRIIIHTKYYKRLEKLNNLNYFDDNIVNSKIRKVTADKLRNMILRAMYNPHTELGKIMFQKRLEIDGLDSIHLV